MIFRSRVWGQGRGVFLMLTMIRVLLPILTLTLSPALTLTLTLRPTLILMLTLAPIPIPFQFLILPPRLFSLPDLVGNLITGSFSGRCRSFPGSTGCTVPRGM